MPDIEGCEWNKYFWRPNVKTVYVSIKNNGNKILTAFALYSFHFI